MLDSPNRIAVILILLAVLISLTAGCSSQTQYVPLDKRKLRGSGKVYFIPLGDFPKNTVTDLVGYYQEKYGLSIETLSELSIDSSVMNYERQQLIAEAAVTLMQRAYSSISGSPDAIMIGLTKEDMYISEVSWQFAFSYRQEGRFAVVSSARMALDTAALDGRAQTRLRKMVTKNVGILYYRLPTSDNPRSVL
ncbi:MAG TPA: hypothetical protein VFV34_11215 [Blastocatellia bacterium]|nr:hypothetical protein [Blastocatellia bacterium]